MQTTINALFQNYFQTLDEQYLLELEIIYLQDPTNPQYNELAILLGYAE